MLNTKLTTVTPQMASQMLKSNTGNRKIRMPHVNRLKTEILAGRWLVTHQGIAFDEHGVLLDGQHRLMAIEAAGKSVQMLVTHGVATSENGELKAMDVIDCGHRRTTGDQLSLLHGVKNTNKTLGALRLISYVYCNSARQAAGLTVGQAMAMLEIYGEPLADLIHLSMTSKLCNRGGVVGALTLASTVAREEAAKFMTQLNTGNGIGVGDPVYALREQLIAYPPGNTENERVQMVYKTTNCLYNTIQGVPLKMVKATRIGLDYFMAQDKKNVAAVRKIVLGV